MHAFNGGTNKSGNGNIHITDSEKSSWTVSSISLKMLAEPKKMNVELMEMNFWIAHEQ